MTTSRVADDDPRLLARIEERVEAWRFTVESIERTASSVILFGAREGTPAVLKIVRAPGDEWRSGSVLDAFDGHGIVRALDAIDGALLLERLDPGTRLAERMRRETDEEATEIIAGVIDTLHRSSAPTAGFATIEEWGRGFGWYRASGSNAIQVELLDDANRMYDRLAATQRERLLLHGDLHHFNIVDDARRGWTAIDPKGVVGEAAYEIGAALRNPCGHPEIFADPDVIRRRVAIFASRLALDPDRMIGWAFAQAVLSAIWSVQDGEPVDAETAVLRLARSLRRLIRTHDPYRPTTMNDADDNTRYLLRHILATIRYRGTKAMADAPDGFDGFDVGTGCRTPLEIVAHIGDLFDWTATIIAGEEQWTIASPLPWIEELERFHAGLDRLDAMLASDMPLAAPAERLIQGPLADALTHIGQLALMRRMSGASIRGENFFAAEIGTGGR